MFTNSGIKMKNKRILRFYFNADALERAMDNKILSYALADRDWERGGEYCAERALEIVAAKAALSELWGYLDRVMGELKEGEKEILRKYSLSRRGLKGRAPADRLAVKRAVMKFRRHARRLERFSEGLGIVDEYCRLF